MPAEMSFENSVSLRLARRSRLSVEILTSQLATPFATYNSLFSWLLRIFSSRPSARREKNNAALADVISPGSFFFEHQKAIGEKKYCDTSWYDFLRFFSFFSFFLHQTAIGEKEETVIALNAMVSNMTRQKRQMVMFIYE